MSAALLSWVATLAVTASPPPDCATLVPASGPQAVVPHALTAQDLVRLRDIGDPGDRLDLESPLALSPDGRHLAFVMRQADPANNLYCQGVMLIDLAGAAPPRLVDTGGELIRVRQPLAGLDLPEGGVPAVVTPRWSPDGRAIAYLKRVDGRTRVAVVDVHGPRRPPIDVGVDGDEGIEDVDWSDDGTRLRVAVRPERRPRQEEIERESRSGFLFDERFRPIAGRAPFPAAPRAMLYRSFDIRSGVWLRASANAVRVPPTNAVGSRFWIDRTSGVFSRLMSEVQGRHLECEDERCRGELFGVWTRAADVVYLRREGEARDLLGVYRWQPGRKPVRILSSSGLLIGCQRLASALICLEESADQPRRIVRVDLRTGRVTLIFDPNPEWATVLRGSVRRLFWTDEFARPNYADFVLPPFHQEGERHPLIVVQYVSRGFLRGGTGDEYPIHLFASRGYAVMSFQYPSSIAVASGQPPLEDPHDPRTWRRSVQASLEAGLARVLHTGTVDRDRMGITGLSDGATSAYWALINSGLFHAAALSSCCMDSMSSLVVGPAYVAGLEADGYPSIREPAPDFWSAGSLAANAHRVRVPILMQLSDNEYLHALQSWYALRAWKSPVEMFVFANEAHVKWQPAHRLAIYQRNLDWFDFWLRGSEDPGAAKAGQYVRWRTLRDEAEAAARPPNR